MQILLYVSLIGLFFVTQVIAATPGEAFERAQGHVRQRQFAEAVDVAEAALQAPELAPSDKARLLKLAADATMGIGRDHSEAAIELYERIIADPAIAMPARLDALRAIADIQIAGLAGQYLHEMDLTAAHETLARGPSLPDLTPHDHATALTNIARLFEREHKGDEARRVYERILASEVGDSVKKQAHQRIANSLIRDDREAEALAIYRAQGLDLIEFYKLTGDNPARQAECLRVLDDPDAPEHIRWSAFSRLPCWDWQARDFAGIRAVCDTYLSGFMESDANRATILRSRVLNTAPTDEPAFIEWAAPILMQAPRLSDEDYAKVYLSMIDALAVQQKSSSAAATAEAMSADQRVSPERRLAATLMAAALAGNSDIQPILESVTDISSSAQAEALLAASRAALSARDETTSRAFHAIYRELLASPDRASITCRFDPDAPFDIGGWLASPSHRDPSHGAVLDRPYGSNLEFLLATDSAVTGRNVGSGDEPAGDTRTDFHAVSDADGIHLFLFAHDSRVDDVLNGTATGGSFEIYLAPGDRQAYYTFLIDLPDGRVDPRRLSQCIPMRIFACRPSSKERCGRRRAPWRAGSPHICISPGGCSMIGFRWMGIDGISKRSAGREPEGSPLGAANRSITGRAGATSCSKG